MKRSPLVVIFTTVFIDLVGFGIVIPVLPFYAESSQFNASPRTVGLLFASYSVMQLIFSPILGRLSDKHGRRPVCSSRSAHRHWLLTFVLPQRLVLFVVASSAYGKHLAAQVNCRITPGRWAKGMGLMALP